MKKILIVNDTPSVNKLLVRNFEYEGFGVDAVMTGREGVDKANAAAYDIILLDYKLPDINGDEVCRAIKTQGSSKNVPIYYISSLDKEAMYKIIADTGAQGFLDVSADLDELIAKVKSYIG